MSESQHTADLKAALIGLHVIARALLHALLKSGTQKQETRVVAHISGVLALASETAHSLNSNFLTELTTLCKVNLFPTFIDDIKCSLH